MGTGAKRDSVTAHRRYLSLLNTTSLASLEEGIVTEVLQAIHEICGNSLPIRLSRVAHKFLIRPKPEFDMQINEGQIEYDAQEKFFIITLGGGELPASEAAHLLDNGEAINYPALTRRLRFTYAHEVAHRFCFIKKEDTWIRALNVATVSERKTTKMSDFRRLRLYEEQLCNRIAGRLLVPEHLLSEHLQPRLSAGKAQPLLDLSREIKSMATLFNVSDECLLIELQRVVERGGITLPTDFCVFFIKESDQCGPSQIAERKLRIRIALLPKHINGIKIKKVFPGMPVADLGSDFSDWISNMPNAKGQLNHGEIEKLLTFVQDTPQIADRRIKAVLCGWWNQLKWTKHDNAQQLLVWGFLRV